MKNLLSNYTKNCFLLLYNQLDKMYILGGHDLFHKLESRVKANGTLLTFSRNTTNVPPGNKLEK